MPIEITMPRLSDTMEQGTIVAWNVKEGDEVTAKVLKVEWDDASKGRKDRVSLSMKQAMADPFKQAQDGITVGEIVSGKVTKISAVTSVNTP